MIKVYTSATCPGCTIAKDALDAAGVDYEEMNIGESGHLAFLLQKGIMQVPAIFLDDEYIESVDELLSRL